MKQQTFIVKIYRNNDQVDFERFTCKKAQTVKANFQKLLENSLYNTLLFMNKPTHAICYATPDGAAETEATWRIDF